MTSGVPPTPSLAPEPSLGRTAFRGQWRSYQAQVLAEVADHLSDGRIHVVAAPGSGKTVLGLELIRQLGEPALILSPTLVIAHQWGQRFGDMFAPVGEESSAYFSENLRRPAVLTSVTYQSLHAAMSYRLAANDQSSVSPADDAAIDLDDSGGADDAATGLDDSGGADDAATGLDDIVYSDDAAAAPESGEARSATSPFDLVATLLVAGVRTICLDEAHHLRREWHKALQAFITEFEAAAEGQIRIVALTATPPFDSDRAEWERYTALCGPIDAEVFVHQLVAQGVCCPHQDYVYLNYPTTNEMAAILDHRQRVDGYLQDLMIGPIDPYCNGAAPSGIVGQALRRHGLVGAGGKLAEAVFEDADSWMAVAALAAHFGQPLTASVLKQLNGRRQAAALTPELAAQAAKFLTERTDLFGDISTEALALAKRWRLAHKGRLEVGSSRQVDDELKRSAGKLDSITRIAALEQAALGDKLRMVVLTDYIRADHLNLIGTSQGVSAIGAVPIFEVLRRSLPPATGLGLVSGSVLIWPSSAVANLLKLADSRGINASVKPMGRPRQGDNPGVCAGLDEHGHSLVTLSGSNRDKVAAVTEALRLGDVRVLVGTAALLGEGWDSPCVNSLVLASFVGSYVLSNQMRGRAIRTDPDQVDKTANIWHLAAVEPPRRLSGRDKQPPPQATTDRPPLPPGADFASLARRFDVFMGPHYDKPLITSGIARATVIRPPFDSKGVAAINRETEIRAANRSVLAGAWQGVSDETAHNEVVSMVQTPRPLPVRFVFNDMLVLSLVLVLLVWLPARVLEAFSVEGTLGIILAAVCLVLIWVGIRFGGRIVNYLMPIRTASAIAEAILATLQRTGGIASPGATVLVQPSVAGGSVEWALEGASLRDKEIFAASIAEAMSPISNPRYLIIRCRPFGFGLRPGASFAAPVAVSTARTAGIFRDELRRRLGGFDCVYTRSPEGRRLLLACRRRSYLNRNDRLIARFLCLASS